MLEIIVRANKGSFQSKQRKSFAAWISVLNRKYLEKGILNLIEFYFADDFSIC